MHDMTAKILEHRVQTNKRLIGSTPSGLSQELDASSAWGTLSAIASKLEKMTGSLSDHRVNELATQAANEIKRKCLDKSSALDKRVDNVKESLFLFTKILKNALAAAAVRIDPLENDRDCSAALALAGADASPNASTKPPPEWAEDIVKRCERKVYAMSDIGDMQGGDKITCTSASYSNTMKWMCRKCSVKGSDAGNPFIECQRMSMVKIMDIVSRNQHNILKSINQYNVHSAWFDVDYGGCRFGISSAATPVEPLHALENGLITNCVRILFEEEMTPKQKSELDFLVCRLANLPRQRFASSGSGP
jgi:hypothetical protein